jgi:electron transport complex protein RnfG
MQRHPLLLLTGMVLLACITLGLVHHATRDRIRHNEELAQLRPLHQLLGDANLQLKTFALPEHPLLGPRRAPAYRASRDNQPVAVLLPVTAPDGYGGPIQLLVAFNSAGSVVGVHLLAHRETPGLGAMMEPRRSDWLRQFSGAGPWALRSDHGKIDQLTGATVTSRAVTTAVEQARQYVAAHTAELFGDDETTVPDNE